MRILFPSLGPTRSHLAPAIQVTNMAQAFAELGHEVTIFSGPNDPSATQIDDEELFGFSPLFSIHVPTERDHRGQSYINAVRVARIAARDRHEFVFSRSLRSCLGPALQGIPTVFEAHTLGSVTGRQDRVVLRRLLRSRGFRGVVAISTPLAEDLVTHANIAPDRILVAHDAVRVPTSDVTVKEAGVRIRVGYTGSLFPGKGADSLIDIAGRCDWADFVIAGGPAVRADQLRERCAREGLTNVLILGPLKPTESRQLQTDCDVLAAPFSRRIESDSGDDIARWTSPMKIFEYMVSGRPMVVTDLPVLREVLRPDIDAIVVQQEDRGAFIAALERLRDDPALGRRLARSALERAHAEFTWASRASRILERFVPELV